MKNTTPNKLFKMTITRHLISSFDQSVRHDMGFNQINIDALEDGTNVLHDAMYLQAAVKKPGYIYIYLSNENSKQIEVYFDDLTIKHKHTAVIQTDDYYPFGLAIAGLSGRTENKVENRFTFQGQEIQKDYDLGWYSFKWRNHDPSIGRFFNVDPLAEDYSYNSPYAFSENKVTAHIELEGLESKSIHNNRNKTNTTKLVKAFAPAKAVNGGISYGFGAGTRSRLGAFNGYKVDYGFDVFHVQYTTGYDGSKNETISIGSWSAELEGNEKTIGGEGYFYRADNNSSDWRGFKGGDVTNGFETIATDDYIDNDSENVVDALIIEVGEESDEGILDALKWFVNGMTNYINDLVDDALPQFDVSGETEGENDEY
jgi:RHS repeat-associated protein